MILGLPSPCLIGVVHLDALPGAPRFAGNVAALLEAAESDAAALVEGGAHALVVENFGDVPFFAERVPAETIAAMALAVDRVRRVAGGAPVGVNVLRNDARAALGLCVACDAAFLRVNVHTGAAVSDQGVLQGRAADTLRERARLCPDVAILADVHVKHASPMGTEELVQAARDASLRGLADALILSGEATGAPPKASTLQEVRTALPDAALLIGSGLDLDNAADLLPHVDGAIVGTSLKAEGRVENPVDPSRVELLLQRYAATHAAEHRR